MTTTLEKYQRCSLNQPNNSFETETQHSPMLEPAITYLRIKSLGIPAILLYIAMQGFFRGFKDTTTPLYAIGDLANVVLDPSLSLFVVWELVVQQLLMCCLSPA